VSTQKFQILEPFGFQIFVLEKVKSNGKKWRLAGVEPTGEPSLPQASCHHVLQPLVQPSFSFSLTLFSIFILLLKVFNIL
jgi:hypothetical protein